MLPGTLVQMRNGQLQKIDKVRSADKLRGASGPVMAMTNALREVKEVKATRITDSQGATATMKC